MQATHSLICFPKPSKSKSTPKKKTPGQKGTVMEFLRSGWEWQFPGKPPKPLPSPHLPPPGPAPDPITLPPQPDNPPRKEGAK